MKITPHIKTLKSIRLPVLIICGVILFYSIFCELFFKTLRVNLNRHLVQMPDIIHVFLDGTVR